MHGHKENIMAEKKALKFTHTFYSDEKEPFFIMDEFFSPYAMNMILDSGLLPEEDENLLEPYRNTAVSYELLEQIGGVAIDTDDGSLWHNDDDDIESSSLFDYIADLHFAIALVKAEQDESALIKIGLITEIIKNLFSQFKIDFSILSYLYADTSFQDGNKIKGLLSKISSHLKVNDVNSKSPKNDIKKFILELAQEEHKKIVSYLVMACNNPANSAYLNQLSVLVGITPPMLNKDKCVCIVENDNKLYFSISGYDYYGRAENYKNFAFEAKSVLEKQFLGNNVSSVEWSTIDEKTKAYCEGKKGNTTFYKSPKTMYDLVKPNLKKILSIVKNKEEVGMLFGCCERKIFTHTDNNKPIKIYCRYAPCGRCQVAVYEQLYKHDEFLYYALAEDSTKYKELACYKNPTLWKLTKER